MWSSTTSLAEAHRGQGTRRDLSAGIHPPPYQTRRTGGSGRRRPPPAPLRGAASRRTRWRRRTGRTCRRVAVSAQQRDGLAVVGIGDLGEVQQRVLPEVGDDALPHRQRPRESCVRLGEHERRAHEVPSFPHFPMPRPTAGLDPVSGPHLRSVRPDPETKKGQPCGCPF